MSLAEPGGGPRPPLRRIVLAYDGSSEAERALGRCAELARAMAADVLVVTVATGVYSGPHGADLVDPADAEEARTLLRVAGRRLEDAAVSARTLDLTGPPGKAIVDAATEAAADLVIVGTRGRGAALRTVLGSVSDQVVREAPCDVLVAR